MIYIPIIIIIIILLLDFYFTYNIRFKSEAKEPFSSSESDEVVKFKEPNPWNKVIYQNTGNKYYLKIKNLNKYINKIMLWKQLPLINGNMIDIDIEKNYLIIKSNDEAEALVNTNLLLSYINDDIEPDDLLGKKLISTSIKKAKKYKLVSTKLIELIKENVKKLNKSKVKQNKEKNEEQNEDEHDDSNVILHGIVNPSVVLSATSISTEPPNINNIINKVEPVVKQDLPLEMFTPPAKIMPYEGSEYASVSFVSF